MKQIYQVKSAMEFIGVSHRHLMRLAELIGKQPTRVGTRLRLIFSADEVLEMQALIKRPLQTKRHIAERRAS